MNARQIIADLLQQWREVTQAESKAIQAADWPGLKTLQNAKDALQRSLIEARELWDAQNPAQELAATPDSPFAAEVHRLLALETRNQQLLEARRQMLRERREMLKQARHNVRRLRHSYAGDPEPKWHSYS